MHFILNWPVSFFVGIIPIFSQKVLHDTIVVIVCMKKKGHLLIDDTCSKVLKLAA